MFVLHNTYYPEDRHVCRGSDVAAKGREGEGMWCHGSLLGSRWCHPTRLVVPIRTSPGRGHTMPGPRPGPGPGSTRVSSIATRVIGQEAAVLFGKGGKKRSLARLGAWRCAFPQGTQGIP